MKWSELSMTEKNEVIKMAVAQGIKDISSIKNLYEESVNGSRRFEDGGGLNSLPSNWTMQDEAKYRNWRENLPVNLRNTNDNDYDMRRAYLAGMHPSLEDDGYYHLGSRDPKTGRILKAPHHPTYLQAINTDARIGYYPTVDKQGVTYTSTWEDNKYKNGGSIHIDPSKKGTFTAAASKHGKSVQEFASQVLAHKENYSPAMVKKANFARNASKWKHGDGGDLYGGELPEVTVTGYAPLRLTTYYPVTSKYPYTGHSELDIPIDRQTWYNYIGEEPSSDRVSPYMTIDKKSSAEDYNLVTNNCADATLNFLNNAFGTSEKPWLFTTPGDVRDYALKELNGKLIENNDGSDTVLIPRNAKTAGKLSTTALNMFDKDLRGTAHIQYKGPFNYTKQYRKRK